MNKITLELKHLAPYLPYGLKILRPDNKTILEMVGLIGSSIVFHEESGDTYGFIGKHNKPILHPLSDLTKEIEVNGERFVPKARLDQSCLTLFYPTERLTEIHGIMSAPYVIIINLHKWHFDVFGLIEQGLAVDINTL